jgi:hypothetical protein
LLEYVPPNQQTKKERKKKQRKFNQSIWRFVNSHCSSNNGERASSHSSKPHKSSVDLGDQPADWAAVFKLIGSAGAVVAASRFPVSFPASHICSYYYCFFFFFFFWCDETRHLMRLMSPGPEQ